VRAARGDLDQFLDLVEGLDGLPRHTALHPCGIVLSDLSLLKRTPVQPSAQDFPMSQFDKDDVEHMGLLKLDVLGVRMQSALAYAIDQVHQVQGPDAYGTDATGKINLESVPRDDPETFALIQSTKTLGCFQIESPGQRELIGKFAPVSFGDLITDISLFRPGPVKSDMITPFLRARQGWGMTDYMHPDLKEILTETSGVVVFHEQVMRIVSVMTGCSLEAADLIRRRMGDYEQLDEIREWFYKSLQSRNYELSVIEQVWDVLRAFASFGFWFFRLWRRLFNFFFGSFPIINFFYFSTKQCIVKPSSALELFTLLLINAFPLDLLKMHPLLSCTPCVSVFLKSRACRMQRCDYDVEFKEFSLLSLHACAGWFERPHTAYVSIRQHTPAYVRRCQYTCGRAA
jgi:hypothetical protein